MSHIIGIMFGGIVLFAIWSWFSAKSPTVKNFWDQVEDKWQQPKGILKVSLDPDGTASHTFIPISTSNVAMPAGDYTYEVEIPVTRWQVKTK